MADDVIHIDIEKNMLTSDGVVNLQINTSFGRNDLIVLFGVSGAGKTTLLKLLAGLTLPDIGSLRFGNTVWFDKKKKINLPPQQRNIGFMFQDYALFPNMTVKENIYYAQKVKDKKFAETLINAFKLTEFSNRKPINLSGGQKQRVALARAISRKPKLLLLDEPLSALDDKMRTTLQEEIMKAHTLSESTTLLVSHDIHEIFRLASEVVMIDKGRLKKKDPPGEVFLDNNISGKFQVTGRIAAIEKEQTIYVVTVITGNNMIAKVIALENDLQNLQLGDLVMLYTKAFNPIIKKIEQ